MTRAACFTLGLAGACLAVLPSAQAMPAFAPQPAGAAAVVPAAYGDVPETGHHRGGRHAGKAKPAVTAGTPKLKEGETPEAAQKKYLKKYGF